MKRKLKSSAGETLVETLFALLVVVLAMTMLAGAIVSAARVNKGAENLNTAFVQESNVDEVSSVKVQISGKTPIDVKAYKTRDDNQYCYYEKQGGAE